MDLKMDYLMILYLLFALIYLNFNLIFYFI